MKSIRTLVFIFTLSFSLGALAAQVGAGQGKDTIGVAGGGYSGGGGGGSTTTGGAGGGGSSVGVGSGAYTNYVPTYGGGGIAQIATTPTFGINDVKIVGTNCVISKLGLTGAIAGSPCAKLYPSVTTSTGTGTGTGVVLGTGTTLQNYSNNNLQQ